MGLFRKRRIEAEAPPAPVARPAPKPSGTTDAFAALRPATRRAVLEGPRTHERLAPALATTAAGFDAICERADDLLYAGCLPSQVVDQAFAIGLSALVEGLPAERDDLDYEFEEWLTLALAEGWRIGRRLLGTDTKPYPYQENFWDVPDHVIFELSTFFAGLAPFGIVAALGSEFALVFDGVTDALCNYERPGWFDEQPMPPRRPTYRAAVAGGIAIAIAEIEVLADWCPAELPGPGEPDEEPSRGAMARIAAANVARATLEACSVLLTEHGYLARYDDGTKLGAIPAVRFASDAAQPCVVELIARSEEDIEWYGTGEDDHVALEIHSGPGPECLDELFEDFASPMGAHASLFAYYARRADAHSGRFTRIRVGPDSDPAELVRLVVAAVTVQLAELNNSYATAGEPRVAAADALANPHEVLAGVSRCYPLLCDFSLAGDADHARARWEENGAVVQRRGEYMQVVAGPIYGGVELGAAIDVLYDDHPAWGHGLAVRAQTLTFYNPDRSVAGEVLRTIADLERDGSNLVGELEADLLGSWFLSPDDKAFYVSFVPEAACYPGIAIRLVDSALARIGWINEYCRVEASAI